MDRDTEKRKKHLRRVLEKPRLTTTPMIDVVFLLLTFFILTFQILVPEGDFNVNMPEQGKAPPAETSEKTAKIALIADPNGSLASVSLNGRNIAGFAELKTKMIEMSIKTAELEAEITSDEHLYYKFVVQTISAIHGEVPGGNRRICEKIRFARPSPPAH